MKMALVMVFSLLLAGTPFLPAEMPSSCAKQPARACCHGGTMKCCAAQPVSSSQPAPAVPAQSGLQNPFSFLAPASLAWTLPAGTTRDGTFTVPSPGTTAHAPLYARNCVRLI